MSQVHGSGTGMALAERPAAEEDEFALDVRVVVAYGRLKGDCPTDDGCGNTCAGADSSCNSAADNPF
ncbi:FxLD family lanthipeptide [Pseudofrankia sp. BMG5.37]|uniref:FxLD family lanthipeptide n=1 Tax=Pseudofrankia sp. BMG5.37 TaxID=3050035 RepID=UPI0028943057|nr:FxLD family lanthipeptide [Pseudofrankia sp. BMG5.37]MDT3444481.1 FxLD family lanthipeptide [Pseudofrankia sp. BMG5.37]